MGFGNAFMCFQNTEMDFGNALMRFQNKEWILKTHLCVSKTKNGFWKRMNGKWILDFGNT